MRFITSLLVALMAIPASAINLKDFCEENYEKRELSKVATQNDGYYLIESRRGDRNKRKRRKYFRGCRHDIDWMEEVHQAVCNQYKVKSWNKNEIANSLGIVRVPENILFFFDGAGDFNAWNAHRNLRPVNLDGSEGLDLDMGNGNGLYALMDMYRGNHALSQNRNKIQLHYHAGSGFHKRENYRSALKCAEQMKDHLDVLRRYRKSEQDYPKWFAMGFSNGGALSIDFQNDFTDTGEKMELVFTIDPVVQAASYIFHMKKYIGHKNKRTKRFVNVYQDTDHGSLPPLKLRGKPVENADVNILMTYEEFPRALSKDGKFNHLYIVRSDFVQDLSSCEFGKSIEGSDRYCD